jgi:hypothetical protein
MYLFQTYIGYDGSYKKVVKFEFSWSNWDLESIKNYKAKNFKFFTGITK